MLVAPSRKAVSIATVNTAVSVIINTVIAVFHRYTLPLPAYPQSSVRTRTTSIVAIIILAVNITIEIVVGSIVAKIEYRTIRILTELGIIDPKNIRANMNTIQLEIMTPPSRRSQGRLKPPDTCCRVRSRRKLYPGAILTNDPAVITRDRRQVTRSGSIQLDMNQDIRLSSQEQARQTRMIVNSANLQLNWDSRRSQSDCPAHSLARECAYGICGEFPAVVDSPNLLNFPLMWARVDKWNSSTLSIQAVLRAVRG